MKQKENSSKDNPDLKAEDLVKLIRRKFNESSDLESGNRYVVLQEVADGTGWQQSRWVDVAVFHMWRMDNLNRAAFEVKISRADLLRELQKPEKYQWCQECFHEFWYVMPKGILQAVDELPKGAGWMYPRGNQLCVGKQASRNPNPRLDDTLLAAFMRSAWKEIRRTQREATNEDDRYQHARYFAEAVERFLNERKGHFYSHNINTADDVYNELVNATMDSELKQDRDHFLELLGFFQRDILGLLHVYLTLAKKSLLLRNDYGERVTKAWGGIDKESLQELKKMLKSPRYKYIDRKLDVKILEALMGD